MTFAEQTRWHYLCLYANQEGK